MGVCTLQSSKGLCGESLSCVSLMVAKHSLTERPTRLATGLVTATVLEGLVTEASKVVSIMDRLFMSAPLKHEIQN